MSDSRFDAGTLVAAMLGILCLVFAPQDALAEVQAPGDVRDQATAQALLAVSRPIHNAYFMPVGEAGPALHGFSGTLSIPETMMEANRDFNLPQWLFPAVDLAFVSHGDHLIPEMRDIIRGGDGTSPWDIILSPGRVWSEAGDGGLSRASFPFVLAGRVWNESHNGIATFVFDDKRVSGLQFQIVQEAASWNRFQAWGWLPVRFWPHPVDGAVIADFEAELAARMPTRLWSYLEGAALPELLRRFDGKAQHVTTAGLVVDGVLYARPCPTDFGDYPYCAGMRHGVYSMTKTMGAALSLLRLAQKYGDEVFGLRIADYLDVTADHDGWDKVTFADALNMATGIGDEAPNRVSVSYDFEAYRKGALRGRFATAPSARAKLDVVFSAGNYAWGPGEVGRYNSSHTFTLAAAMDALLKRREGPAANLWDMVVTEVLKPVGVFHAPMMHTREPDGGRGVPIMGWGYFPTMGEMAKIAGLLQGGGAHQGRQLLSAAMLRKVFPGTTVPGLPIYWGNAFGRYRYHMSFWYMPFRGEDGCFVWIPEMMGYGGNLITLMPNGMTGIRLADANEGSPGQYDGESMARLADNLKPFCR